MGLISRFIAFLQGTSRTDVTELLITFADRLNDEHGPDHIAMQPREKAAYDRLVDGLNRLPRPLLALGSLILILAAMVAPVWFADRMEALAQMPDALWWLIGAIISLYFGARMQATEQKLQREIVETIVKLPDQAPPTQPTTPRVAETGADAALALNAATPSDNPALAEWNRARPIA